MLYSNKLVLLLHLGLILNFSISITYSHLLRSNYKLKIRRLTRLTLPRAEILSYRFVHSLPKFRSNPPRETYRSPKELSKYLERSSPEDRHGGGLDSVRDCTRLDNCVVIAIVGASLAGGSKQILIPILINFGHG